MSLIFRAVLLCSICLNTQLFGVSELYSLKVENLERKQRSMGDFRNKVLLIVNIASECGYTPQLEGLQKLYKEYEKEGLVVLGFPSHSFKQEPLEGAQIGQFCKRNFGVEFPIFKKSHVTGEQKNQVFRFLISQSQDKKEVSWNFEKFLVSRSGKFIQRFPSSTKPNHKKLMNAVELALKEPYTN